MDWDKLRFFYTVAKAGSFTKASHDLNISQSAISRQVNLLEEELGSLLFTRMPRGVVLTEAGRDLYNTVKNVYIKLETTQAAITELKNLPQGHLRIAAELTFGSLWLAPLLQEFLDQYPDIRLTLLLSEEETDLNMKKADVGITSTLPTGGDVISHHLISYPYHLYASRSYLETYGWPQDLKDLDRHRLLVFGKEMPHLYSRPNWLLTMEAQKPRNPFLVVNTYQALLEAVRAGLGIAALHKYIVGNDPHIIELFPDYPSPQISQYVIYPSHLVGLKRAEVFLNFLSRSAKEESL